jgi:hypothetical protein
VAAAMSKTTFDMGFVMADVRPSLPTVSAEDELMASVRAAEGASVP